MASTFERGNLPAEGVTFSPAAMAGALARVARLGKRGPLDRLPGPQFLAAAAAHFASEGAEAYGKALPIVKEMDAAGESLRAIADRLNGEGITTPRGAEWTAMQISRLLKRA